MYRKLVQANEVEKVLAHEIEKGEEFLGPMTKCLQSILKDCKRKEKESKNVSVYIRCMMDGFAHCLSHVKEDEDPIVYRNIKRCTGWCTETRT
jgi:hypothetical protein